MTHTELIVRGVQLFVHYEYVPADPDEPEGIELLEVKADESLQTIMDTFRDRTDLEEAVAAELLGEGERIFKENLSTVLRVSRWSQ